MRKVSTAAAALLLLAATAGVQAHHGEEARRAGDIAVSHVWTQARGATADVISVYMTISNLGEAEDRLVSASAGFASGAVFAAPVIAGDGGFRLEQVQSVEVAGGERLTLQPGSAHIQLTDVQRHFPAGDHFDMTLVFERAGPLEIEVEVEQATDAQDREQPAG